MGLGPHWPRRAGPGNSGPRGQPAPGTRADGHMAPQGVLTGRPRDSQPFLAALPCPALPLSPCPAWAEGCLELGGYCPSPALEGTGDWGSSQGSQKEGLMSGQVVKGQRLEASWKAGAIPAGLPRGCQASPVATPFAPPQSSWPHP